MPETIAIPEISPAELAQLRSEGQAVDLIDVRSPMEFADVHAAGAKLIPLDRCDPKAVSESRQGPASEPIYLICHSGGRARKACEAFRAAGIPNVVVVQGGMVGWQQAGLPVVRGQKKVMSLERQVRVAAGSIVLVGVILGWLVHPAFFGLSAFVGAGLIFAGITDWCGMGMLIAKMPWNQRGGDAGGACSS